VKVLMTGASGLLGRHLLPTLRARGHRVVTVSRHPPAVDPGDGTSHVAADLLRQLPPREALRTDALVHLAWETTPGSYWNSPENDRWRDASQRLVERFLDEGGRRVLVAGSCAEYRWDNSRCM
jgi:nucleoside-diphosphate-sugar epimerase